MCFQSYVDFLEKSPVKSKSQFECDVVTHSGGLRQQRAGNDLPHFTSDSLHNNSSHHFDGLKVFFHEHIVNKLI